MYTLLLVSPRMGDLSNFTDTISAQPDIILHQVDSRKDTLRMVQEQKPHLVIIDQEIREKNPLDLVMEILVINAMINTAMITSMDADEWHEKSEGLGMMPPISNPPTEKDAHALLESFRKMPGLD